MERLISVIIPIYNAEKYIRRCIESVLNQTFGDFELILVDDGSKDGSAKICDEYAEKDGRVSVFHLPNGGVSRARNYGIDRAVGKYIEMIDSDDYLDSNTLEVLYNRAERDNSDVVIFGINNITGANSVITDVEDKTCDLQDFLKKFSVYVENAVLGASWNKLYSIKCFNDVRYDENVKNNEDMLLNMEILLRCKVISLQSGIYYNYMHNGDSASSKYIKNLFDVYSNTYYKTVEFLKAADMYEYNKDYEDIHFANHIINAILNEAKSCGGIREQCRQIRRIVYDPIVVDIFKKTVPDSPKKRIFADLIIKKAYRTLWILSVFRRHKTELREKNLIGKGNKLIGMRNKMPAFIKQAAKYILRSLAPKLRLKPQTVFINKNSWQHFNRNEFAQKEYSLIAGDIRLVKKSDLDKIVAYFGYIDKKLLKKMPNLKYLQIPSHGYNGFDDKSIYASNELSVAHVKDIFSNPIAEYCITAYRLFGCYGLAKSFIPEISVSDMYLPENVKVIIFGAGNIGKKLAELCKKQDWTVWGVKRNIPCEVPCCYDRIVTPNKARELLGEADFVVNLLPLTAETQNFFNLGIFKQMKKTALFCNVGRGASVNEDDLVYAVKNKIIRGAVMDASTRKSFKCPNIICTHHTSSVSPDNAAMLDKAFTSQLNLFLSGKTPDNVFFRKGSVEVE